MTGFLRDAAPALLLTLPTFVWLSRALLPKSPGPLNGAIVLALWLVLLHITGLATGSFYLGLWVATGLLAGGGFALRKPGEWTTNRVLLLSTLAVTGIVSVLAFGWAFHDETPLVGHMSITNQLLSDTYPPRFVSFPAFELRYHYGFNLVSATWSALSTLPAAWGIDLATVGLGALTWGLLWSLGERVIGTGKGLWAALLGLFSAGLAMGVAPENAPLAHELLGHAVLDGAMLNPPTISYFFQHPWTLGIPLALAAMVLLTEEELTWKGAAFVGLLLLALSFSQVVLFVCLLPTAVAVAALQHGRFDKDQALKMGSIALVVVAVATQLGGLFTPRADPLESEFAFRLGVTGSFGTTLEWHLHSFGLPLLLGVAGVATLQRGKLLFGLLIAGSLLVINTVTYTVSWDILKFATVSQLALGIGSASAIVYLFDQGKKGAGGICLALSLLYGVLYVGTFALEVESIPAGYFPQTHDAFSEEEETIGHFLQETMGVEESLLVPPERARAWAQHTGLGQAWTDGTTKYFGASQQRIDARKKLLQDLPIDATPFVKEGITWAVFPKTDHRIERFVQSLLDKGEATIGKEDTHFWILQFENTSESSL